MVKIYRPLPGELFYGVTFTDRYLISNLGTMAYSNGSLKPPNSFTSVFLWERRTEPVVFPVYKRIYREPPRAIKCVKCQVEFSSLYKHTVCCSTRCTNSHRKKKKHVGFCKVHFGKCQECSSMFTSRMSKNFCSSHCYYQDYNRRNYKYEPTSKTKYCKVCSKDLGKGKSRYCKEHLPSRIKPFCKIQLNTCTNPKCKKTFLGRKAKFCSRHCSARSRPRKQYPKSEAVKRSRRRRKWVVGHGQPISKLFRKEIADIYENRKEGYEVDHIIPLNHELVCGLHIPQNLQYLTKEDNGLKSNHFELIWISY